MIFILLDFTFVKKYTIIKVTDTAIHLILTDKGEEGTYIIDKKKIERLNKKNNSDTVMRIEKTTYLVDPINKKKAYNILRKDVINRIHSEILNERERDHLMYKFRKATEYIKEL